MRKDFAKAASKGTVIKNQNFVTAHGVYQIVFVRYENDIYFFKHRNGKLVECCNLSNLRKGCNTIPTVEIVEC